MLAGHIGATTGQRQSAVVTQSVLAAFKFTGASLRIFGLDLSQHPFTTGGRQLLFPGVLRDEAFAWAALLAFVLCTAAYLIKCGNEVAQRSLNVPKTLHMTLSAGLFFITPALENLDVAFHGLNTWHSFQSTPDGMIGSATVARFAARGWGLYAVGIALTAACGVLYLALRGFVVLIDAWPGDVMQQHYFCFLRIDCIITPPRGLLNQRTARHSPRLSIPCPCHDTPPFT